jgi:hypothetical protein
MQPFAAEHAAGCMRRAVRLQFMPGNFCIVAAAGDGFLHTPTAIGCGAGLRRSWRGLCTTGIGGLRGVGEMR